MKTVDVFARPARDILVRLSRLDTSLSPTRGGNTNAPGSLSAPTDAKVKQVKLAVDEVKNIALDNVERVIQRGQRIDDIVQATDDLQFQAQGFQRNSRDLRNQLWWNSMKGKLLIGGVAVIFILLVLFTFFGGNGKKTPTTTTTTSSAAPL